MFQISKHPLEECGGESNVPGAQMAVSSKSTVNHEDPNRYCYNDESTSNQNLSHHNYCNIGPVLGDVVNLNEDQHLPPPPPEMLMSNDYQPCIEVNTLRLSVTKFVA